MPSSNQVPRYNKKKWYSERRRKYDKESNIHSRGVKIRRNDTLKGDGNFPSPYIYIYILYFNKKKWYSERRRKYSFYYNNICISFYNKKKWYSERRRKFFKSFVSLIQKFKIRRNDTLKGDGNPSFILM